MPKLHRTDRKSPESEASGELAEIGAISLNHRLSSALRPGSKLPLAMQKVVGSNPIIRSKESPGNGAFLLARLTTKEGQCKRICKRLVPMHGRASV